MGTVGAQSTTTTPPPFFSWASWHDTPSASPPAALRALINPFWVLSCRDAEYYFGHVASFLSSFFCFWHTFQWANYDAQGFTTFFALPFLASLSGVFIFAALVTSHPFVNSSKNRTRFGFRFQGCEKISTRTKTFFLQKFKKGDEIKKFLLVHNWSSPPKKIVSRSWDEIKRAGTIFLSPHL